MKFNVNVGGTDRVLRIAVGAVLMGASVFGLIGVWGYIGIVPLLTGLFSFCPAYQLLGKSTCPVTAQPAAESPPASPNPPVETVDGAASAAAKPEEKKDENATAESATNESPAAEVENQT